MPTKTLELTPATAWKKYWTEGLSFPQCAEVFGVSVGTLHRRFKDWKFPTRPRGSRGGAGPKVIVTDDGIRRILETVGELDLRALSVELGVSRQRIDQIRHGKHRPI